MQISLLKDCICGEIGFFSPHKSVGGTGLYLFCYPESVTTTKSVYDGRHLPQSPLILRLWLPFTVSYLAHIDRRQWTSSANLAQTGMQTTNFFDARRIRCFTKMDKTYAWVGFALSYETEWFPTNCLHLEMQTARLKPLKDDSDRSNVNSS